MSCCQERGGEFEGKAAVISETANVEFTIYLYLFVISRKTTNVGKTAHPCKYVSGSYEYIT